MAVTAGSGTRIGGGGTLAPAATDVRSTDGPEPGLGYGQPRGRRVLAATVLGSAIAQIDGTITNIALPTIGRDLHAGLDGLTWVLNAYTLTLASLILIGGSLGDRVGRRRVFVIGVLWFAAASVLCAVAPTIETLVAARALQGVGGALLVPGSLALIQASFRPADRARAVGAWSGLGGVAGAVAPFLGGWLLAAGSWRWIFVVNVPVAALVLLAARHIPESRNESMTAGFDVPGTVLGALGLGGVTLGLSSWSGSGIEDPGAFVPLCLGVVLLAGFVAWERHAPAPILPLSLFGVRLFSATNAVTFAVYAGLGGVFFWLVLDLQVVVGFTPIEAGLTLLPGTVLVLLLSARAGRWGQRVGPRLPMTLGPALCAVAVGALARMDADSTYVADVLGPVLLLGLGLVIAVAPLTATALAAAPDHHAGLASGVNHAVARAAGLLAVAALPVLTGLGDRYTDPQALDSAYRRAMWVCAGMLVLGALLAAAFVRTPTGEDVSGAHRRGTPADPGGRAVAARRVHCALDAPPLHLDAGADDAPAHTAGDAAGGRPGDRPGPTTGATHHHPGPR